jgi:hypothetical protein
MTGNRPNPGENSGTVQIILGVIALIGVLAGAIFPNWDKIFSRSPQPATALSPSVTLNTISPPSIVSPPPAVETVPSMDKTPLLTTDYECHYELPANLVGASVDIQPEKKIFTVQEQITAKFSIHGVAARYEPWMTVILSSEPELDFHEGEWKSVDVDKEGTVSLPPQSAGDYQIRLLITDSGKNVLLGYCPITVK